MLLVFSALLLLIIILLVYLLQNQFRKRVGCLERLLAEERTKVSAAEKKLRMTATDTISTGLIDDAKLHLREKEILQNEVNNLFKFSLTGSNYDIRNQAFSQHSFNSF